MKASKVRVIIPVKERGFPDDTIILDGRMPDRFIRGKCASMIEVSAELTTQNDVRDLIRNLEIAYTLLEPSPREIIEPIMKPNRRGDYLY